MAQRRLNFELGHYYHVYNRGAHKLEIFRARKDYHFLLKLVKEQTQKLQISVIAYCLMPNHYHFLFRQNGEREISVLMQAIFNVYSKAFNTQHGHSGTLFEGPFKAIWVDRLEYLLHLCRYIHRNPLEAGLVTHPEQWEYSNYREFVGKRAGVMVDKDFVKEDLGTPAEYESFVMEYVPPEKSEKILHHYLF